MKTVDPLIIYTLWLREMKRYVRAKSRIIGSLAMPFFFLAFLGMGFRSSMSMPGLPAGMNYIQFLAPGIIGMTLLMASMFAGISVLWDRQFGFLKEIMVAPVSRTSIVLGRIAGGATTAIMQGMLIAVLSSFLGFKITSIGGLLVALLFMVLISTTFIGLGLAFASKMEDMHGFQLIMNFLIMPMFFLSGALFPLGNLPSWLTVLNRIDPLTYGVDGMRGALIGVTHFGLVTDLVVLVALSVLMVALGAYLFSKTEVD